MSAANNDLSQTIALITTANTIAQNPESVGTGLKTMALRLRSTKTEIEQMGEDAEGAAENVSKLREQVLALTKNKVDIQIDENTYKSSYEILLEISKVWNELNDISQASLLEQLFGKRQANVGAAILENGELLQQVYETAENSIGSATKEQERFSKSIQYSINSFKAAYQTLASDVVGSKFVKEIVDLGSEIIKGLDFIITKTGILQGLLVGFGSLAIFKTIPALVNQIKTLGASLTAFGTIMNTLGASGGGSQVLTLQQLALASKSLTDRQFELVLSTKNLTNAQLEAMMTARGYTQEQIQAQLAIRQQTVATTGLSTAEKGATASTFTLSGALKGLGAAIAANPIGAIVTAITLLGISIANLKNKYQDAIVEAKRLEEERQQHLKTTVNELESFEREQDSIDDITEKYVALLNTTSNIESAKESLVGITDELNEKLGDEKTQIDLVNGSLSENIELIRQQQLELDKQWQRKNKGNIKEAQDFVSNNSANMVANYSVSGAKLGANYDEAVKEAEFYFNRMKHLIDENDADLWNYLDTVEEVSTDKAGYMVQNYGFKLKEGLDQDVIPEVLKSFRNLYEQLEQYSYMDFKWFRGTGDSDIIDQSISDWEKYLEILNKNKEINNELWDNTAIGVDETKQKFSSLIDKASELSRKINDDSALPSDVYIFTRELDEVKNELNEIAESSPELQKRLELVFSTIGLQAEDVSESADLLKNKFFDVLEEMQKGVFDKVDKINEAIVKMLSGEGIDSADAWELLDMDTTGILTPIIDANGEWIIQSEQLVAPKERLVGLSREQVQADLQAAQSQVTDLDKQIAEQYAIIKQQQETIAQTTGNSKPNEDNLIALRNAKSEVDRLLAVQKKYSEEVKRDNLLLQELNRSLELTTEQTKKVLEAQQKQLNKELTALNKELDNYQKAYEAKIDGIIKGLEAEEDELEKQLDVLEDELDVLEKQKDAIEETLDNYEKVNSYVQKIIDKEIEGLEEQRDAIKNTYDERINKLKEENEEREDALDYAQKLANLENAQNNRRRVYDEERGWHYATVKEDVVKAESDLKAFETNQEVKKLEKERDAEIKAWDALIKQKEDYKKQWAEWLEEIQLEESEALAQEILGAEWREKIANGDLSLIETFSAQYRIHNAELKRLTDTEIKLKKAEIDAKNEDIKASKERITAWKNYKQEFSTAVTDIKQANEDYMKQIGDIQLSEASTLEERGNAFETFKNRVSGLVDQIGQKQGALDNVTASLEELQDKNIQISFEIEGMDLIREARDALNEINANSEKIKVLTAAEIFKIMADNGIGDAPQGEQMAALIRYLKGGYSSGGVADYTGLAMLHGRKNAPETIFNASDSAKLYDMVHNTPNLMADMLNQATKLGGFKLASNEVSNNNSNVTFYIDKIVTDSPVDFERQLDKYYRTKLTQSYTSRQ